MNLIVLSIFIFYIMNVEGAVRKNRTEDLKKLRLGPKRPSPIDFTFQQRVEQYTHTIQAFEAFNLKSKYELGKMIAMIINHSRIKNGGVAANMKKPKTKEVTEVEADVIDENPEESWRIAESYMKAYKEKEKNEDGWDAIKTPLRAEPVYVRGKVTVRAIADEEVNLLKRLVQEKYTHITIERYNYAVRKYKENGTENSEKIVDFIAKNNPELGAAISDGDILKVGFDQVRVHDYIYENNYPMLIRALDQGFDPNFVIEGHGSLLGLSVVSGCFRCVAMLIERGADVNVPIELDGVVRVNGWNQLTAIKGWTPLMVAVADGNVKIVTELIESGSAFVSKTAIGKEAERFHAREVARRIKANNLRKEMLDLLFLSSQETENIQRMIKDFNFEKAIENNDYAIIDAVFLIKEKTILPTKINVASLECDDKIIILLRAEGYL